MNNRYISRGKRKDNGTWVDGNLVYTRTTTLGVVTEIYTLEMRYEVIPKTVGQYTGLKDKNGKKIFEGDIVESRASENKEDWKRWVVQFTDGSFCFEREIPRKRKYKYEQNLLGIDNIELYGLTVIGNIHDNPKLLQRSDEK